MTLTLTISIHHQISVHLLQLHDSQENVALNGLFRQQHLQKWDTARPDV